MRSPEALVAQAQPYLREVPAVVLTYASFRRAAEML